MTAIRADSLGVEVEAFRDLEAAVAWLLGDSVEIEMVRNVVRWVEMSGGTQ